jgi:hypothetical protein
MSAPMSAAGLIGRAMATVGAIVMGVSLLQPAFEDSTISNWDVYRRIDLFVLAAAVATLVLLLVSLFAGAELLLFFVSVLASFVLGFFLLINLEFPESDLGGWFLAIAGSAAILVGAAIALVPALVTRAGTSADLAFLPVETSPAPEAHPAGWYSDPSGQAGLRYWDGQAWTERTRQ